MNILVLTKIFGEVKHNQTVFLVRKPFCLASIFILYTPGWQAPVAADPIKTNHHHHPRNLPWPNCLGSSWKNDKLPERSVKLISLMCNRSALGVFESLESIYTVRKTRLNNTNQNFTSNFSTRF